MAGTGWTPDFAAMQALTLMQAQAEQTQWMQLSAQQALQLAHKDAYISQLLQQVQALNTELRDNKQQFANRDTQLTQQIHTLNKQLDTSRQQLAIKTASLQAKEEAIYLAQKNKLEAQLELQTQTKKYSELDASLKETTQRLQQLPLQLEQMSQEHQTALKTEATKYEKLADEKLQLQTDLQAKIQQLETDFKIKIGKLETDYKSTVARLQAERKKLEDTHLNNITTLKTTHTQQTTQLQKQTSEQTAGLTKKIKLLEQENVETLERIQQLTTEHQQTLKSLQLEFAKERKQTHTEHANQVQAFTETEASLRQQLNLKDAELEEIKRQLKNKTARLKNTISTLRKELAQLKTAMPSTAAAAVSASTKLPSLIHFQDDSGERVMINPLDLDTTNIGSIIRDYISTCLGNGNVILNLNQTDSELTTEQFRHLAQTVEEMSTKLLVSKDHITALSEIPAKTCILMGTKNVSDPRANAVLTYMNQLPLETHSEEHPYQDYIAVQDYLFPEGKERRLATANLDIGLHTYQGQSYYVLLTTRNIQVGEQLGLNCHRAFYDDYNFSPVIYDHQNNPIHQQDYRVKYLRIIVQLPDYKISSVINTDNIPDIIILVDEQQRNTIKLAGEKIRAAAQEKPGSSLLYIRENDELFFDSSAASSRPANPAFLRNRESLAKRVCAELHRICQHLMPKFNSWVYINEEQVAKASPIAPEHATTILDHFSKGNACSVYNIYDAENQTLVLTGITLAKIKALAPISLADLESATKPAKKSSNKP